MLRGYTLYLSLISRGSLVRQCCPCLSWSIGLLVLWGFTVSIFCLQLFRIFEAMKINQIIKCVETVQFVCFFFVFFLLLECDTTPKKEDLTLMCQSYLNRFVTVLWPHFVTWKAFLNAQSVYMEFHLGEQNYLCNPSCRKMVYNDVSSDSG